MLTPTPVRDLREGQVFHVSESEIGLRYQSQHPYGTEGEVLIDSDCVAPGRSYNGLPATTYLRPSDIVYVEQE